MLWAGLPEEERRRGAASHLRRYSELVEALYFEIPTDPEGARAVVRRDAEEIFSGLLAQLGIDPTYEQALTLANLARCHLGAGNPNGPGAPPFSEVLDRLLRGERDRAALWDELDLDSSMIVAAILQGIAEPGSLRDVVSGEEVAE
jgi:hypothetical protein